MKSPVGAGQNQSHTVVMNLASNIEDETFAPSPTLMRGVLDDHSELPPDVGPHTVPPSGIKPLPGRKFSLGGLRLKRFLGIALGVGAIAVGGYFLAPHQAMVLDALTTLWQRFQPAEVPQSEIGENDSDKFKGMDKEAIFAKKLAENPYLVLPNELGHHPVPMGSDWAAGDEKAWREGLKDQYLYQHFKTVLAIRASRLRGSEVLLFEALREPKFWTRMAAVIALAEFGNSVDRETMALALGKARPSLVRGYFSRFSKSQSPGEWYIMRQALHLVDGSTRQVILETLATSPLDIDKLYVAAASFDQSQPVKNWFREDSRAKRTAGAGMTRYKALVVASDPSAKETPSAPVAKTAPKVELLSVEALPIPEAEVPDETLVQDISYLPAGALDLSPAEESKERDELHELGAVDVLIGNPTKNNLANDQLPSEGNLGSGARK